MGSSYLTQHGTRRTPQSAPIPGSGQVPNSAGGHAWAISKWDRLQRFLILGSEGGTYYAGERQLTAENAQACIECIAEDGVRTVTLVRDVSTAGRAPKPDPAIFALAMAAGRGDKDTRIFALRSVPDVCRTGTHLFAFAEYLELFRGWGKAARKGVAAWYEDKDPAKLAYQAVKYRQRGGWSHDDLVRLSHPQADDPATAAVLEWIAQPAEGSRMPTGGLPAIIGAFEAAQASASAADTAALVRANPDLPREALNPDHLTDPAVWDVLLAAGMPTTALVRNLATMTRVGLLKPMGSAAQAVVDQLADTDRLRRSRIHPVQVLAALFTYAAGRSARGSATWEPVGQVVNALDRAFYDAFGNVEPTGKRTLLAIDVSPSMNGHQIAAIPGLTARAGAAAMALVTASVEPVHKIVGFAGDMVPLGITAGMKLNDAIARCGGSWARTDCAQPMLWALNRGVEVDAFVVYTDNETWSGSVHPAQALQAYREQTGIPARLAVVGMASNGFSIADPDDPGMLDLVGFDTAAPGVLSDFVAGVGSAAEVSPA